MTKAELERDLGVRGGVVRVGALSNDAPVETFEGLRRYGIRVILVMQSGLDPLTLDREKFLPLLSVCDDNFKKKEELFKKYANEDDYEVMERLLFGHKLLSPMEVKKRTVWASEQGLYKILPLLLSYAESGNGTLSEEGDRKLARIKAELLGNKKGCIKHFRENAEDCSCDREIVLLAVKREGSLLSCASPVLAADREIALAALAADKGEGAPVVSYVSRRLFSDEEVVKTALTYNPKSITCMPREKQEDRDFVLLAVKLNGTALAYVPENFKKDREIVLAAISSKAEAYALVEDPALRADPAVGIAAVKKSAEILADPLFREHFSGNREVMLEALKRDARSIRYLSNDFRQDVSFALEALKIDKSLISAFFYNVQSSEEVARVLSED